jgi:glycosyltransferase involved in cell wall biosynthesis
MRERRFDAVIALGWSTNVFALAASAFTRIPILISERTDPREHHVGRMWHTLQRITYRGSVRLVVQTESVKAAMRSWVRPGRIEVIPNPVLQTALDIPAIPGPLPLVVAMGRMTAEKGFDALLRAFAIVLGKFPESRLRLIGDGPLRNQLEELTGTLGIGDSVEFTGVLASPHQAMSTAWCSCLASRFEGFPNALLESMAMGLPVVATDCRSGPADLLAGGAGILVPVDDIEALSNATVEMLTDRSKAAEYGRRARARAEEFGSERIFAEWDRVLADSVRTSR